MAHRVAAASLLLIGLGLLAVRPLVGFIILVAALAAFLDDRGAFGHGTWRAMIAFITGLWVALAGVVATLLGMFALPGACDATTTCDDPEANFLFLPGVVLLVLGTILLVWAILESIRLRRAVKRLA